MKQKLTGLSQRYVTALRQHLKPGSRDGVLPAQAVGRRAVSEGLETLDLARMHEQAIKELRLAGTKNGMIKRAEKFFNEAMSPIVETHRTVQENRIELNRLNRELGRRTDELAAANRYLQRGIDRRKSVEAALKESGIHYSRLLKKSLQLQEGLRRLAHRVMAAQEVERHEVTHGLQDEVAQTLLGVNARLLALKQEARRNTKGLKKEIASTQRMVVKSAKSVRRVARKFRSA